MNTKFALHSAIAALLFTAAAAQAGTVTFTKWAHGKGNSVDVQRVNANATTTPYNNLSAGGFSVSLANFTGLKALNGTFEAYCVELDQTINLKGSYGSYSIVTAASHFSVTKLEALTKLFGHVGAGSSGLMASAAAGFKDEQSTALQLAIWNIVYDTDKTLDGGTFSSITTAMTGVSTSFIGANSLLTNSTSFRGDPGFQLYVLKSANQQDQIIAVRNAVPEPGTLALVALALGGMGFVARRRS